MNFAHDLRFAMFGHGQVGILPISNHAQALELFRLCIDPFLGELAAFLTEGQFINRVFILSLFAVAFFDFPLDRQAVTIPTRNIRRVITQHLPAFINHVFKDFIQGVPHMDIAVGVRRAVMQNPFRFPFGSFADFAIQINLLPFLNHRGLFFGQVAAHREFCLRKEDAVFEFILIWVFIFCIAHAFILKRAICEI